MLEIRQRSKGKDWEVDVEAIFMLVPLVRRIVRIYIRTSTAAYLRLLLHLSPWTKYEARILIVPPLKQLAKFKSISSFDQMVRRIRRVESKDQIASPSCVSANLVGVTCPA